MAATAAVVNLVTPGWVSGREYRPPTGPDLVDAVLAMLPNPGKYRPNDGEIAELSGYVAEMRKVFTLMAGGDGDLDAACEVANNLLHHTGAIPVLARHDGAPWHLHFHSLDASWARSWAGPMAVGLAMVLGSTSHDRLGVCSAPSCDWVYVDTSRNGARRFCGTACQNRVKAAAFRERQRA